jgi:hypothetical protein
MHLDMTLPREMSSPVRLLKIVPAWPARQPSRAAGRTGSAPAMAMRFSSVS